MLLDVDAFLIGGGFGSGLDRLKPYIENGILERSYGRKRGDPRFLPAELGVNAS